MKGKLDQALRAVGFVVAGMIVGMLILSPASAHIGNSVNHLWTKHIRPLADGRYFTKTRATDIFVQKGEQIYAYVKPHDPGLVLDPARTHGFESVTRMNTGVYCLDPSGDVDPDHRAILLTPEFEFSAGTALQAWAAVDGGCPAGQFTVFTRQDNTPSDDVAFFAYVP